MRLLKALSTLILMTSTANFGLMSWAETHIDENLKSNYTYTDLSAQSKLEATSMLMLNNSESSIEKPQTPQKKEVPTCMVNNKQFVHCSQ